MFNSTFSRISYNKLTGLGNVSLKYNIVIVGINNSKVYWRFSHRGNLTGQRIFRIVKRSVSTFRITCKNKDIVLSAWIQYGITLNCRTVWYISYQGIAQHIAFNVSCLILWQLSEFSILRDQRQISISVRRLFKRAENCIICRIEFEICRLLCRRNTRFRMYKRVCNTICRICLSSIRHQVVFSCRCTCCKIRNHNPVALITKQTHLCTVIGHVFLCSIQRFESV